MQARPLRFSVFMIVFAVWLILSLGEVFSHLAQARMSPLGAQRKSHDSVLVDDLQWTYRIDRYIELADSGWQRGENIISTNALLATTTTQ
jgi:hypothetical protein